MAPHSSISCLENSMDRGSWQATVHGVAKELYMTKQLSTLSHALEPVLHNKRSHCEEKPAQQQKNPMQSNEDPQQPKRNK